MVVDCFLLAAKHSQGTSGAEAVIALVGIAIALIIFLLQPTKEFIEKNGIPCCPKCGCQISLKASRPNCRSCGANLMTGKPLLDLSPTPPTPRQVATARHERLVREEQRRQMEIREEEIRVRRAVEEAAWEERRQKKLAKRQAKIDANGGFTDLQLYGLGILIAAVPAALAVGIYYLTR